MELIVSLIILVIGLLNPYSNKLRLLEEVIIDITLELSGNSNSIEEYYGEINMHNLSPVQEVSYINIS